MTGIERLREVVRELGRFSFCYDLYETLGNIADQIEREHDATVADSPYDAILPEDREAIAWVREHGGLNSVKKLLDWVVGHCSTRQQLDFDFWLSGRVMHELGFEKDMADRDEVERRLLARLMPEGMTWPRFEDDEPVKFGDMALIDGEADMVEAVQLWIHGKPVIYGDGGSQQLERGERVKRPAPRLDADGVETCEGDTVYLLPGEWCDKYPLCGCAAGCEMEVLRTHDVDHDVKGVIKCLNKTPGVRYPICYPQPSQLTHERPVADSWERLEEDCAKSDVDYCAERGLLDSSCDVVEGDGSTRHCTDCGCTCGEKMARDLVRRARALAERGK